MIIALKSNTILRLTEFRLMTDHADDEIKSLYIRFYCDEDVSVDIAHNLQQRGFDVLTTRDALRLTYDDNDQLAFAVEQQRAIITHNRRDFEVLHQTYLDQERLHMGIIIVKRRSNDAHIVSKLLDILNTNTADEICNTLLYV